MLMFLLVPVSLSAAPPLQTPDPPDQSDAAVTLPPPPAIVPTRSAGITIEFASMTSGGVAYASGDVMVIGEPIVGYTENGTYAMVVGPIAGLIQSLPSCAQASAPIAALTDAGFGRATRRLAIQAGDAGRQQAIRVTFNELEPPYNVWNGERMWVQMPQARCEHASTVSPPCPSGGPQFKSATLGCSPHYMDWSTAGTVYIHHEGVIPRSSYTIEVIDQACDAGSSSSYSPALAWNTSKYGDSAGTLLTDPPNGAVALPDVNGILQKFSNASTAPIKARVDHSPRNVDHRIDLLDVNAALQGFANLPYPETPSMPDPCP